MALSYSTTLRNAQLDQITTAVGASGKLRIYSGTRPANVAASITGTMLAELVLNATFAPSAAGGVLTLNSITSATAAATGTATHFRIWQSNGTTAVMDGDVGTAGSDLNLNSTSITSGGSVAVTSFTDTAGNA
jgi:hypothetical protein